MKTYDKNVSVSVKCPMCRESLMDSKHPINEQPSIKLNIEMGDERGIIRLCSIYGCYTHNTDIKLIEDEIAKFYCPHCNHELISDVTCKECNAKMVPFVLAMGGKVSICSRKGCEHHHIEFDNVTDEIRKFYYSYKE